MLKHPDKFLPVTSATGLLTEASTSWNGDFRVKQGKELYFNPFREGHRFFRVVALDVLQGPAELEEVRNRELLKSLREAKNSYIRRYFE